MDFHVPCIFIIKFMAAADIVMFDICGTHKTTRNCF